MKKTITYSILGLLILIAAWRKMFWLSISLFIIGAISFLIIRYKLHSRLKKTKGVYYSLVLIIIILGSIALRLFVFEIYTIPSESMEDAILPSDIMLAGKLAYGPRMPESPYNVPWFNLIYYLLNRGKVNTDSATWRYRRLKGFSDVQYNDVVIFNLTNKELTVLIKRCTGLPGDTLKIVNDSLYINNKLHPNPETAKFRYRIYYTGYRKAQDFLDSMGIKATYAGFAPVPDEKIQNYFSTYISPSLAKYLLPNSCIDSIHIDREKKDTTPQAFLWNKELNWTIDNYGSVCITQKGLTIRLNDSTFALYKDILHKTEQVELTKQDKDFIIDGEKATTYTFRFDYYWIMGNNRHNSQDSRIWGSVPEPNIIGKTPIIIFSKGGSGIRWNRILKKVN